METRERILEAAERVMRERGLARATTKEIARAAGVSEGSLYNHFADKEELFLSVLGRLPSGFVALVHGLPERAGSGTLDGTLSEVARAALDFYDRAVPMGASVFAEAELLARLRAGLRERGAGPQRANEAVATYLRAEQRLGRVRRGASPDAAAYLLLGAAYQRAYWRQFLGEEPLPLPDDRFVEELVALLVRGLSPAD